MVEGRRFARPQGSERARRSQRLSMGGGESHRVHWAAVLRVGLEPGPEVVSGGGHIFTLRMIRSAGVLRVSR